MVSKFTASGAENEIKKYILLSAFRSAEDVVNSFSVTQ